VRDSVEVNAIIPAVDPDLAAQMARASGCSTVKIKVGDPGERARVAAVRRALPEVAIRLDVNGAWTLDEATRRIAALSPYGLEYVEQPVRGFDDMVRLRARVEVRLAADEVLRLDRRFDDVALAADVAVLKVAPLGGVGATLEVARRVGVPVVISSALDTSVGLAAGLAAACALPETPPACGLGTGALFAADTTEPLVPVQGRLHFAGRPQPGPDVRWVAEDIPHWRARIAAAQDAG
jgi:O-succinylbenzoate synthase